MGGGRCPRRWWSIWTDPAAMSDAPVMRLLQAFGSGPVIVEDYLKSRKHYWV